MLKTVSSITNAIGALNYKGTWDASTNTPTLADGTGVKGDYYVVSTAGTQTFNGILLFFGAGDWIVYNGAVWQRVEGGSDGNFANVTLNSTDAGATASPLLDLYRNSASPAASDTIGEIEFNGQDSAGNKQAYALFHGSILSPTSGAEQGQLHFETATAGALTEKMIIGTTNLVINDIGAIYNVRIEGDTDANLFFTDATNSRVGIGIITPAEKLDVVGNIKLSGNVIPASGFGIDFAATAGSGTSELLADYEEGTWTPSITFNVPGDLSVAYDSQVGRYTKIGNRVVLQGYVVTTTFTHTTASSYLKINGLPFAASSTAGIINVGPLMFRGITKAGYTDFVVSVEPTATSSLLIYCSASGTFTDFISAADMPSGGTVNFRFTITYQV
jgi:hypothetical protein